MRIEQNYSLLKHNTFGLDVKTRYFVEYESEADLLKLLRDEYFFSQRFWHIGRGSNLLFLGDFDGIIVHSAIGGIEIIKEDADWVCLKAGAGNDWDAFVAHCVENGWGGLENLSLIPGEVGASAVQNIGAYGVEVSEYIEEVHTYFIETGEKRIFSGAECNYAYRHSFFKEPENKGKYYITQVVFKLSKKPQFKLDYGNIREQLAGKPVSLDSVRQSVIAIRESKLPDPEKIGNAGSFFVNPYICIAHYEGLKKHYPNMPHYPVNDEVVKIPAAWLIDQCGLKGKTVGGAAIHEKQPLVIINQNQATGEDIAALAEEVCRAVKEKFFIDLQPEVNYI
ncbi:UDP-N-acetylenolpyruvoylglucosamine reductase [Bacteroidia bacterium]|nr:UDP-N-acetylenolpyruvoylglucosamine reductase [Bacteroidia bacterium]GHT86583.1 UDP-N-acetylenolpyruvoylglucosamine reductase [Bacteroidia bacterium]